MTRKRKERTLGSPNLRVRGLAMNLGSSLLKEVLAETLRKNGPGSRFFFGHDRMVAFIAVSYTVFGYEVKMVNMKG